MMRALQVLRMARDGSRLKSVLKSVLKATGGKCFTFATFEEFRLRHLRKIDVPVMLVIARFFIAAAAVVHFGAVLRFKGKFLVDSIGNFQVVWERRCKPFQLTQLHGSRIAFEIQIGHSHISRHHHLVDIEIAIILVVVVHAVNLQNTLKG